MAVTGKQIKTDYIINSRPWWKFSQRQSMAYLMVLPSILVIVLVVFLPISQTIWLSLNDYDKRIQQQPDFIGLQNYMNSFTKESLRTRLLDAFGFTTGFALISVGLEFVFGMGVALVLNQQFRGRALVRAVVLIPWV